LNTLLGDSLKNAYNVLTSIKRGNDYEGDRDKDNDEDNDKDNEEDNNDNII
jgi:hypothetical protein